MYLVANQAEWQAQVQQQQQSSQNENILQQQEQSTAIRGDP